MKLINQGSGNALLNDNESQIVDTLVMLTPLDHTIVAIDLAFYRVYIRKSAAHRQRELGYSLYFNKNKTTGQYHSCTVVFAGHRSTFKLSNECTTVVEQA